MTPRVSVIISARNDASASARTSVSLADVIGIEEADCRRHLPEIESSGTRQVSYYLEAPGGPDFMEPIGRVIPGLTLGG